MSLWVARQCLGKKKKFLVLAASPSPQDLYCTEALKEMLSQLHC